jgi:3-oxoacyl-[acyl-carrier protein] reductase
MSFSGRTAIVTGAAGGMGLAIAAALVAEGAAVTLIDAKPEPGPLPAGPLPAGPLPTGPGRATYARGDLTDAGFVARAIKAAHQATGRLDHLVNAAGVLWFERDRSAIDMDLAVWDQVMAINLKSMVHTMRAAVPLMKAGSGGSIVNIATIQCLRGDSQPQDAYQASKAGVVALTKSIAIQFARDNIRANTILPGPTRTPMQARWDARPDQAESVASVVPLGRLGRPEDIANAALFLLSDKAAWITGTELIVDGGLMARP